MKSTLYLNVILTAIAAILLTMVLRTPDTTVEAQGKKYRVVRIHESSGGKSFQAQLDEVAHGEELMGFTTSKIHADSANLEHTLIFRQ